MSSIEANLMSNIMVALDDNESMKNVGPKKVFKSKYDEILQSEKAMDFEVVWDMIQNINLVESIKSLFKNDVFKTCPDDMHRVINYLTDIHNWRCKPNFDEFRIHTYAKWTNFVTDWNKKNVTKFLLSYLCVYCVHCQHKITVQDYKDMIKEFN